MSGINPNYDTVIIYEHGDSVIDAVLSDAIMFLALTKVQSANSAIPSRAERWQPDGASGGMYQLAMALSDKTGIPEVDAILQSKKAVVIA